MAAQDRSDDVISNVENGSCNSNEGTNHETSSDRIANAAKVRKPYTVTKQREKWSEAEHERFLEAIQLYGRAWRQIQEHIGTKTAVQIRSHAQKFFSKVAREADSGSDGSIKTVVIPPPRPKRKPAHPYPRKSPAPCSQPPSSAMEKGNKSPTSVLSPFASDDHQVNRCSSPNSCTSDIQSFDKKNDYATSKQSFKEIDTVTGSTPSIMLFGKIVLVAGGSQKTSPSREDGADHESMTGLDSRHVDTVLSLGVCETSCTGSNAFGSVTEVSENLEKSAEARKRLTSLETQEPCYRANGFRPYKRCLSEREVTSSLSLVAASEEEGSRRRARVCS